MRHRLASADAQIAALQKAGYRIVNENDLRMTLDYCAGVGDLTGFDDGYDRLRAVLEDNDG